MIDIDVMQDASEIVHYDNPKIPLYIRHFMLSSYPNMKALCHWHEDIEMIFILSGEMNYDINGKKVLLKQGDSIIINSKQMHYGYSNYKKECSFLCILFHPSLLMSQTYMNEQYIIPIIDNSNIQYLFFENNIQIGNCQKKILEIKKNNNKCFEFEIISVIYHLWTMIYEACEKKNLICTIKSIPNDLILQKNMVSYIYKHYSESISLDQIAQSGNVSRSKCCILFKKYFKQSPIDFLNSYRLKISCNLLKDTKENISTIALSCGFNHLSYFSKIFCQKYGCTPNKFRHQNKN